LRPREQWIGRLPTFDVAMAWREPLWQVNDSRWPHPSTVPELLGPEEFMEMYAALPEWEHLRAHPHAALQRLKRWQGSHPSLARREPARTILSNAFRAPLDTGKTVR
jgi:hypothetical protein